MKSALRFFIAHDIFERRKLSNVSCPTFLRFLTRRGWIAPEYVVDPEVSDEDMPVIVSAEAGASTLSDTSLLGTGIGASSLESKQPSLSSITLSEDVWLASLEVAGVGEAMSKSRPFAE